MDRREFSVEAARILLGGAALVISGCASDTVSGPTAVSPTPSAPPVADASGTISSNHNHSAVITAAQLTAGGGLELDIRGSASHSHMLSLTGSEVTSIRLGAQVQKETSGTSHTHIVTFNA